MITFKLRISSVMAVLLLVTATACGSTSSNSGGNPLTQEQVTQIANSALTALDTGDYAAYTQHFSGMMKSAVPESTFKELREQLASAAGKFVSIEKVDKLPAQTQGYVRWTFTVNFEKRQGKFTLVIREDGDQIEGVHFE
jgi:hypothetical protein